MKCIAIDDEPFALGILEEFCRRLGDMDIRCFSNPEEGLRAIQATRPDLVFLDIELGGMNGLELAKLIPAGISVVFTTAYARYALDGFELEAVDFLHKPFSFQRFGKAVRKVSGLMRLKRSASVPFPSGRTVSVISGYRTVNICTDDILFIESLGNYIYIHLSDSRTIPVIMRMKDIIGTLPAENFVRVHKSYIVQTCHILSRTSKDIILYGGKQIPVGRAYAHLITEKKAVGSINR